jgi:hypothetical protein
MSETKPGANSEVADQAVNQALLEANGNFDGAAAVLSLPVATLREYVKARPALGARWLANQSPPPPLSIISRDADLALSEAFQREEKALAEGVAALNLSARAKSLSAALHNFNRKSGRMLLDLTNGGIGKTFLETLVEIEKLNVKLERIEDVPPEQRLAMESIWREDRSRLLDYVIKASTKVDQGILVQAKIQKMFGEESKGRQHGKPGFSPLKKANAAPP